jgi:hypothetical protein
MHPEATSYGRKGVAWAVDRMDSEFLIVKTTMISAKPYFKQVFFLFEKLFLIYHRGHIAELTQGFADVQHILHAIL